jgi:hypothetical protein
MQCHFDHGNLGLLLEKFNPPDKKRWSEIAARTPDLAPYRLAFDRWRQHLAEFVGNDSMYRGRDPPEARNRAGRSRCPGRGPFTPSHLRNPGHSRSCLSEDLTKSQSVCITMRGGIRKAT